MAQVLAANKDCWYGVEDTVLRKKIQNRLAQRARRNRLAGRRETRCSHASDNAQVSAPSTSASSEEDDASPQSTALATLHQPYSNMSFVAVTPVAAPTHEYAAEIPPTVFAALWDNGAMLGLLCSTTIISTSNNVGLHIPESLHPTETQLTVSHPSWVDRFPFPKFRDNFILCYGVVDEEAFLRDLFSMDSFSIKPGRFGWDPTAWSIRPGFAAKWGYLFC